MLISPLFGYAMTAPQGRSNEQSVPASLQNATEANKPASLTEDTTAKRRSLSVSRPLSLQESKVRSYRRKTEKKVNILAAALENLTDAELEAKTEEFRDTLRKRLKKQDLSECQDMKQIQAALDEIQPEVFAVMREACRRRLKMRPYDVQVMGGMALHEGSIAEMRTGEGKTLTAVLPAYLNALMGKGVHIQTANDYLAQRDSEEMRIVFNALGVTVGLIRPNQPLSEKRQAYQDDITYGTTSEMIFDYLRNNLAKSIDERPNPRGYFYVIADEADKLMLDEALTPHRVSAPTSLPVETLKQAYRDAAKLVHRLEPGKDKDYEVDERRHQVTLTETGEEKIAKWQECDSFKRFFIDNALQAKTLYRNGKDYEVSDGQVLIVDEPTGRFLHGRKWSEGGLQQAVEAKEELYAKIAREKAIRAGRDPGNIPEIQWSPWEETAAMIGYRSFFLLYQKRSGMTGTAKTSETEFKHLYNLDVLPIPTNKTFRRIQLPDILCENREAKHKLVVQEIIRIHRTGQPILVGTNSVEDSEEISRLLKEAGFSHQLLNAKYASQEAEMVANAGRKGIITISTNMAGRGTDIRLGGDPKRITEARLDEQGITPGDLAYQQVYDETFAVVKREVDEEAKYIKSLGGLYVLGTERATSRRIDDQLAGRCARQGDPGTGRFITSLEDAVIKPWITPTFRFLFTKLSEGASYVELDPKSQLQKQLRKCQIAIEMEEAHSRKIGLELDMELNLYRTRFYENRDLLLGVELPESKADKIRKIETKGEYKKAMERMAAILLEEVVSAFGHDHRKLDALTAATKDVTEPNRADKLKEFTGILYGHEKYQSDLLNELAEAFFDLNREKHLFGLNQETQLSEKLEMPDDPKKLLADLSETFVAKAMKAWEKKEDGEAISFDREQLLDVADEQWKAFLDSVTELELMKNAYALMGHNANLFYISGVNRLFQQMNCLIAFHILRSKKANFVLAA